MLSIQELDIYYEESGFVLSKINLSIESGKIVAILGANGAGKSSLMRCIAGLQTAYHGEILWNGRPLAEQYERFSFMTEAGSYFANMTPLQYGRFLGDFFPYFNPERFEKLLVLFELEEKLCRNMSLGQRAKLEIAAGFSKGAKLLLLDEPFLGEDIFTRRDFLKLMLGSFRDDETILIATHQVQEIEHVIDRAVILHDKKIIADETSDALNEQGLSLLAFLQESLGYDQDKFDRLFQFEENA